MSELQGLALREWAQLGKPLIGGDARKLEALLTALEVGNTDLRRQLAEAYERCAHICNRLADESSTTFVRAMSESIEENKMRIARMQGLKTAEEEIRALIPTKEADHAGS